MADLIAQEDQVITRFPLVQMTGNMPEIEAREKLSGLTMQGILPLALPRGRSSYGSRLRMVIYHLHNYY
jgi:hypothetical protein